MMSFLIGSLLLPALVAIAYRWIFVMAHLSRSPAAATVSRPRSRIRFSVIVPAHDEELVLADCLRAIEVALARANGGCIYVVADNCSDRTSEIARARGARLLERREPSETGKGSALAWLIERLPLLEFDAVAVVDADTLMDPDFLVAAAGRLESGARIVQGFNGIANPDDSPLTRLILVTNVMKNLLYSHGKSLLGLSPHLMGTGMVFRSEVLVTHGWLARSIVESIQQSLLLVAAGERVVFAPEAKVLAQEAKSLAQALPQRQRWASGQMGLLGLAWRFLRQGTRTRDVVLCDAALDLILPVRYAMTLILATLGLVMSLWARGPLDPLTLFAMALVLVQLIEFGIGATLSGVGWRIVSALSVVPAFLLMKLLVFLLASARFRQFEWRRTLRHDRLRSNETLE